jgi:glycosyltransferase involved in cell wall biosynthesis
VALASQPRVSIVLPAWNAAPTIATTLASITRQTETSWECIVVDDGSSDATTALVGDAASRDRRVRVVTTPHRGLIHALNEGLSHSRAALIARMDADDVMHRDRLAAQIGTLAGDSTLAAVGCHVRIFPRRPMAPRLREYESWLNSLATADDVRRDAFVECPIAHPTLMMRREIAELRYCDHNWPEDYDLILRALGKGLRIGVVPRRLLQWRDRPDSLSRIDPRYSVDRFTACKAFHLANGLLAAAPSYVLWGYGATGRTLRRALARHGKMPSHIIEVKTSRIGHRIHGALVVPIEALSSLRGRPIVVSVAREGPRREIRQSLAAREFVEGRDFVCAA